MNFMEGRVGGWMDIMTDGETSLWMDMMDELHNDGWLDGQTGELYGLMMDG